MQPEGSLSTRDNPVNSGTLPDVRHLTAAELDAGLDRVRRAPADAGTVELIVRRPSVGGREVVEEAVLDLAEGLVGDNWRVRGSSSTPDRRCHPDKQVNVINARLSALVAGDEAADDERALAGDQLHLDLDLSVENLPPGTRLAIGEAVIEVTAQPHLGCYKFRARYGPDAMRFVNSPVGRGLRLRGACTKVVVPGVVRRGDRVLVQRPLPSQAS